MKNILKYNKLSLLTLLGVFSIAIISCDFEYDLPEANSIADQTPPQADFQSAQGVGVAEEWKDYTFSNLSTSATTYLWDFGDGNTSTSVDAMNTYPGEGTFTVTLTASDNLGVTSVVSKTIEIVEPDAPSAIIPVIGEAGFEDGDDSCGTAADGRDCWRISGGTIFGITSSPVNSGSQGAKFDAGSNRVGYQALTVSPNTDYTVTIYYTIKTAPTGSAMRLAILGNAISNASEAEAAIIASVTGNDQSDANTYVPLSVTFNSGASNTIAIWIDSNNVAESRVDDVSIVAN
ncbi:PKD domain-containing protein [Flavobacterium sp. LMO8]|uniref:PKD domain-containing protein n=1 Tax=Flavobacterium sp. LMO8 TaxID=2654244 RepID=UPI001292192D|nr:PKD domain-containing protein [Flavobacterium sp. LMO8]MQP24422.1 PKD domain-containing protein [Flavobacterium sp. LMO8]